jgi:hypothetical protein
MATSEHLKKAQSKASSPEARAKAVATMKRRRAEKEALLAQAANRVRNHPANKAALLKHAKITKGKKVQSISLDMIPDMPTRKKYAKKSVPKDTTRQEVVLALLRYLNGG